MFEIELFWHLTMYKQKTILIQNLIVWNRIVYMYKNGFGINNLQWLMCQKTKPNQTHTLICRHTCMRVSWKVHCLYGILLWGLFKPNEVYFFNIVPLSFFRRYCSAWIPLVKKISTADMMSSYELFCLWTFLLIFSIYHNMLE